jgi:DNA-binding CsgD family transcriptional regulator
VAHLKNIFAKTATRTQAQLVRLLLSSVPPVS